jgi:hypothetical protein
MTEVPEPQGEEPHQENPEQGNLGDGHLWMDLNIDRHSEIIKAVTYLREELKTMRADNKRILKI